MSNVNVESSAQAIEEKSMKLDNFRLLVNDFPAALHFWQDIIGLPLIYKDDAGEVYAYFETGSARLELLKADYFAAALGVAQPAPIQTGQRGVIVFRVDDVDATYADLVKRGAASIAPPKDRQEWFCRSAHLAAPDGYVIEIFKTLGNFPGN
jgi:catechol 2,3-dioxygenase-like lactoylglutathione lyase family enzyme